MNSRDGLRGRVRPAEPDQVVLISGGEVNKSSLGPAAPALRFG